MFLHYPQGSAEMLVRKTGNIKKHLAVIFLSKTIEITWHLLKPGKKMLRTIFRHSAHLFVSFC